MDENFLKVLLETKKRLVRMHRKSNVGHLGGNLSCLDALMVLHHHHLSENDEFVLSKGHSAGAFYVTLWSVGEISEEQLDEFHGEGTVMTGHPTSGWHEAIPFSTGSLGHGLSLACGMALGKKLRKETGVVYCLISDGEWNEGSTWEALMFASHHGLNNLICCIDANGLQGFGRTDEVLKLSPLEEKLRPFDVAVSSIPGHDLNALFSGWGSRHDSKPTFLIANTVKGKGLSFFENQLSSHYLPLTEEQCLLAEKELEASHEKCSL